MIDQTIRGAVSSAAFLDWRIAETVLRVTLLDQMAASGAVVGTNRYRPTARFRLRLPYFFGRRREGWGAGAGWRTGSRERHVAICP